MGPYVAEVLGPICAARFAAQHPGVRLRTTMNDPAVVARALRARTVDLAIAEASVLEDDDAFEVIAELTPLAGFAVVRAGHPLAGRTNLDFAEVLDYPFAQVVMLPPRVMKPILAARRPPLLHEEPSPPPFPAIECPTIHFATRIVANTNAFTFASLGMVRAELERGQIVPLLEAQLIRVEWNIVRLRKRTSSPAMDAFVEAVQRAHADMLREEGLLRERWFASAGRPSQAKHGTQPSQTKPRKVAHAPLANKRR
jgi:DNA-binding transcriptional LysR family regulator